VFMEVISLVQRSAALNQGIFFRGLPSLLLRDKEAMRLVMESCDKPS